MNRLQTGTGVLPELDPPEARALIPQARDPNRRWYSICANYNTPAYNADLVKLSENCAGAERNYSIAGNGLARSPSTTPTTNG